MARRSPKLMVLAVVLAAASACSESTSARLMAPDDAASGTKSSGSSAAMTYTSQGGVTATTYSGNTVADGNSSCSALGLGSSGTKVDGANSQSVAGYRFTVSGSDKQFLAFAPIPGTTPTTLIRAVIVKGGPAYNVYVYSAGQTSDAGLTSPLNGGGNIPTISHYVVCYGPGTPPPVFTKKLVGVMRTGPGGPGTMEDDPTWVPGSQTVIIPWGETRWLDYELTYSLPSGMTGTISEDSRAVCSTLGTFTLQCSFSLPLPADGVFTWPPVSGNGSILVMIDLGGGGNPSCGDHEFINTAKLTTSTGGVYFAKYPITVRSVCPPKP